MKGNKICVLRGGRGWKKGKRKKRRKLEEELEDWVAEESGDVSEVGTGGVMREGFEGKLQSG